MGYGNFTCGSGINPDGKKRKGCKHRVDGECRARPPVAESTGFGKGMWTTTPYPKVEADRPRCGEFSS